MKLKKLIAVSAVCVALAATLVVPASAHGGHGRRTQTYYPACTVENCSLGYAHNHNGTTYCGNGGGHHGGHC